jgi:DNA replication protein DnaC
MNDTLPSGQWDEGDAEAFEKEWAEDEARKKELDEAREKELTQIKTRWEQRIAERTKRFDAMLEGNTETPCQKHPDSMRPIDRKQTWDKGQLIYGECPRCIDARRFEEQNRRLHATGVQSNLLHCTLDNWTPRDPTEEGQLAVVRDFAKAKRGCLIMLGGVGVGKTHLAVAVMRAFTRPIFFKQNTLLRALRRTYSDPDADDPIQACQEADLLVLDELGVSSGGKDEYPLLYEILDYRYGEYRPTVVTSNATPDQLRETLGDRLVDRIRQSTFRLLLFGGKSHREDCRQAYLAHETPIPRPMDYWADSLS